MRAISSFSNDPTCRLTCCFDCIRAIEARAPSQSGRPFNCDHGSLLRRAILSSADARKRPQRHASKGEGVGKLVCLKSVSSRSAPCLRRRQPLHCRRLDQLNSPIALVVRSSLSRSIASRRASDRANTLYPSTQHRLRGRHRWPPSSQATDASSFRGAWTLLPLLRLPAEQGAIRVHPAPARRSAGRSCREWPLSVDRILVWRRPCTVGAHRVIPAYAFATRPGRVSDALHEDVPSRSKLGSVSLAHRGLRKTSRVGVRHTSGSNAPPSHDVHLWHQATCRALGPPRPDAKRRHGHRLRGRPPAFRRCTCCACGSSLHRELENGDRSDRDAYRTDEHLIHRPN